MMFKKALAFLSSRYCLFALRVFIGGVFVYASLDKIRHPAEFAVAVANYRMLPDFLVNIFAICLPWVELVAGGMLIAGLWRQASALVISGMLFAFVIAISAALLRGLDISCGCFDTAEGAKIGASLLIRDIVMLAASLHLAVGTRGRP